MEVSLVKELDFKGKEPVFDSNSRNSLVELRSTEQVADDDDEEANKCEHFTIRGYVAKVRRRDAKICWPLFLPHNQTSDELVSLLPPLPVTKFRWWNCQKCLSEASSPEDVIADGVTKVQNDGVNTCNTSFLVNADVMNLLSGLQQPSKEKILDGKSVEAGSSFNVTNGECSLSPCSGKKENASINHDPMKEAGPGRSEENQNQSSEPTIFAAEPTIAPNECKMPLGVDINIPKADALAAISVHMSDHDSLHLNKRHTKASDNSMDLPNDINHHDRSSELGDSHGKFHCKKARKVRFLDDIIRSEELSVPTMVHISSGDAKAGQTKTANGRSPDISNWKLQHPDDKSHLATQSIQETPSIEASQNEDEENSLMDWLKKVSKKASPQKGHSGNQHLDATVGVSSGSSSKQGGSRCKKKSASEKENKMTPLNPGWPCLVPQQDSLNAEDESTKLLPAKTVNNKSTGCIVSEKSLHRGPEIQEETSKKSILSKKKNKAPPVEDRLKVKKKAIKKQQARSLLQEGLDDIPLDIVELLAKHQHERCLMSAGVAAESMHNLSKMTGNMRDSGDSEKGCDEGKIMDMVHKNPSHQRSHFNQAVEAGHTTTRNNSNVDCRLKASDSSNSCKQNLHIDLNQQPTEFLELLECSGDPLSRLEHPVTVSNRSYSPQNFGLDMNMQTSGSCDRSQAIATEISSRDDHEGTSVPLNGTAFGSITRRADADFNYVNMDSHNSCLDQTMKTVGQKTDSHDSHDSKFTSLQLLLGKEKADSSINIHSAATYSFVEAGNACHSRTIKPLNLYTNETISALHLLRLMDQTAGSGASYTNQAGSILEYDLNCTNQHEELQGLEVGFRKEMPKHPYRAGYSDQDQHPWNASIPHHPVRGISYVASLLNKEIVPQSNNCPTLPGGLEARHPVELPLHNIIEKEKADTSCSAIHTEFGNTKTSIFMGINAKQMIPGLDSFAHPTCCLTTYEMDQAGSSSKDRADQPPTSSCEFENCVVNRNPADFATIDEDECMIGINNPKPRYISLSKSLPYQTHPDGRKQQ
ncbi:hypothetical protein COCNU_14G003670 [Cocos nucifera]|uniref:Protein EMBRYONIC FLOWER 1-like n=1 Tax=Cocos nucifera TaxID=13894 RepID=A0A8K0NBW8_COCNU|nr:hypothetical protein COCNU_14G003670 [Cocos nucifera]